MLFLKSMKLRQPIITFVGHIDHGKTSLQDFIRHSSTAKTEAGAITQHIGSSNIPLESIMKICGNLLEAMKLNLTIPGLLLIDTPGHAAFVNMRKRGGNLADIAVLVIDVNKGIMPQTLECIEILKQYKTPFIIALNKIDTVSGWQSKNTQIIKNISSQPESVQKILETKLYDLVGKLSEISFNSERFDRVDDYTKQVAIIPTSAMTGEGVPELLMVLTGLSQKYMEHGLNVNLDGPAYATVLEIKEEQGLGKTMDVILHNGTLKKDDILVIGTLKEPVVTRVKALLEPLPLKDMKDRKTRFSPVEFVSAAAGVKISAMDIDDVVAGMPMRSCSVGDIEKSKEEIKKEIDEVILETSDDGIVVKADSLGSLEAMLKLLKEENIPVKKATIGNISKKDIFDASSSFESDRYNAVILGFNVELMQDIIAYKNAMIFTNSVIYKLIEDFQEWKIKEIKNDQLKNLGMLTKPCKIQILKGYVFRQSNPAIVGIEVLEGTLSTGTGLMKGDGIKLSEVKNIQLDKENVHELEKGKQAAISLAGVTIGRQVHEGEVLYSSISEEEFRKMKENKKHLSGDHIPLLKEIADLMRESNPVWGI
jgi:translation initiation factor 5B